MWRSIDALQLTMILPLTNVTVEGNIDMLYHVVNKYSNKPLSCGDEVESKSDDVDGQFFRFNNSQRFSKNFEDHGKTNMTFLYFIIDFPSVYLIENISIMIDNLTKMLYLTVAMCITAYILDHIKQLKKYALLLKNMFALNFIIKFIVDFSLRLMIFSVINLSNVRYFIFVIIFFNSPLRSHSLLKVYLTFCLFSQLLSSFR